MLLMVEESIRGGICHAIHQYTKANKKYIKDYDNNKVSICPKYWDINNSYGWVMSQMKKQLKKMKKQDEETSKFNEDFIKSYNEMKL